MGSVWAWRLPSKSRNASSKDMMYHAMVHVKKFVVFTRGWRLYGLAFGFITVTITITLITTSTIASQVLSITMSLPLEFETVTITPAWQFSF